MVASASCSIGVAAGFVSGLLGIGGGLVMVPLLAGWLGMPLKRALGTSLAAIVGMVVPGTHRARRARQHRVGRGAVRSRSARSPAPASAHAWPSGPGSGRSGCWSGGFMLAVAVLYGAEQVRALTGR